MNRTGTHVIVVGNEKGGSGKSTTAFHLAIYLLHQGFRVASIDVDSPQQTFTHYVRNRRAWAKSHDLVLPHTTHYHLPLTRSDSVKENHRLEFDLFRQAVIDLISAHADALRAAIRDAERLAAMCDEIADAMPSAFSMALAESTSLAERGYPDAA